MDMIWQPCNLKMNTNSNIFHLTSCKLYLGTGKFYKSTRWLRGTLEAVESNEFETSLYDGPQSIIFPDLWFYIETTKEKKN